jgi:hypothetical protein
MANTTQLKGSVELADGTSTVLTAKKPITMGYTISPTSYNQIGYSETSAFATYTYVFSGGDKIYGWRAALPAGTYMCSAQCYNSIATDYNRFVWSAIQLTPTSGYNWTDIPAGEKFVVATSDFTPPNNIAFARNQTSTTIMISGLYTTICFVTNTFVAGTPSADMSQAYTITRIG